MSYLYNGNVNVLNEVEIKNDVDNPIPVSLDNGPTSPVYVELTSPIEIVNNEIGISEFPALAQDAFGRLRTSSPFTLFDSQHRYAINDKWDTATVTGGSTSHDSNASVVNMNVNSSSGAQVIMESKRVMAYQPGKSLLIYATFVLNAPKSNLRQRIGYFGAQNGIFIEQDGSTLNFVLRGYSGGTLSEDRVAKGSWNVDNLDGTGPSGVNISDFSKALILFIDIEWLGVGDVRVGFMLNGKYVLCHVFRHTPASTTPVTTTYMTTACLPLRYEITNTAGTGSSSTLKHICSTVISEAGYQGFSKYFNANTGYESKNLTTKGTTYPILSIRINSTRIDSIIIPAFISAVGTSNQTIQYKFILNGTLTGASWVQHSSSNVDYDISATAIAGGTDIAGGYLAGNGTLQLGSNNFNFQLGRTIAGVSDIFTIVAIPTSNNLNLFTDLSWFDLI